MERGERVVVGVNRFAEADEEEIPLLRIDPALETKQVERLRALRGRRDSAAVEDAIGRIKRHAAGDENLMPAIVEAAKAYVTLGEICDALREVWGVWRETPVF